MKAITVEAKLKEIAKRSKTKDTQFLIKEVRRHRRALKEILNNYYCTMEDPLDPKSNPFKDVECPSCLAHIALSQRVEK